MAAESKMIMDVIIACVERGDDDSETAERLRTFMNWEPRLPDMVAVVRRALQEIERLKQELVALDKY